VFPDAGHGFARPPNNIAFFGAAEAFLSAHLGGDSMAASPEMGVLRWLVAWVWPAKRPPFADPDSARQLQYAPHR
jgi:hypothetical protein